MDIKITELAARANNGNASPIPERLEDLDCHNLHGWVGNDLANLLMLLAKDKITAEIVLKSLTTLHQNGKTSSHWYKLYLKSDNKERIGAYPVIQHLLKCGVAAGSIIENLKVDDNYLSFSRNNGWESLRANDIVNCIQLLVTDQATANSVVEELYKPNQVGHYPWQQLSPEQSIFCANYLVSCGATSPKLREIIDTGPIKAAVTNTSSNFYQPGVKKEVGQRPPTLK